MFSLSLADLVLAGAVALLLYVLCGITYRLYFHPLSAFPGPKLAAATLWVEFYYDVVRSGMYIWEIEKMHKRYGPIVRISPHELHILDADYYDQIYTGANEPKDKYTWHAKAADCTTAIGFTVPHELHRIRRASVEPFFSKRSVTALEDVIKDRAERLSERVEEHRQSNQPINMTCAYLAYATDVITGYAFNDDYKLLDLPDFNAKWKDEILCLMRSLAMISHFPQLPRVMERLPSKLAAALSPEIKVLLGYKEVRMKIPFMRFNGHRLSCDPLSVQYLTAFQRIAKQIDRVLASTGDEKLNTSIFEEIRDSEELPPLEKRPARLADEASILMVAASETPAKVLAIIHYHLLAQPKWAKALRDELKMKMPDPRILPSAAVLEELPILNACIKEGLRLHNGVTTRSQRVSHHDVQYNDWTIPAGTPISSILVFIHYNPDVFPDSRAFKPERWIEAKANGTIHLLEKHFHPYSKGTRSCLGRNLAKTEIHFILAALFRRFDMALYETDFADVNLERDWFVPQPRWDSKGVRAKVLRRVQ